VFQYTYTNTNFIKDFKKQYGRFYDVSEIPTIKSVSVIAVKLYKNK
jgi:hypothetical protein